MSRFIAAVEHADGYNGHTAVAYVVWDDEHRGLLAVYPHGWHACPNDIGMAAVRQREAEFRSQP